LKAHLTEDPLKDERRSAMVHIYHIHAKLDPDRYTSGLTGAPAKPLGRYTIEREARAQCDLLNLLKTPSHPGYVVEERVISE
jgi:hypothetical protein